MKRRSWMLVTLIVVLILIVGYLVWYQLDPWVWAHSLRACSLSPLGDLPTFCIDMFNLPEHLESRLTSE